MDEIVEVDSPEGLAMDQLCDRLREWSQRWVGVADWPADSLRLCGRGGVYRWFLPRAHGGMGWSEEQQTRGYLRLAQADLTTTFVITQYMGAIRRIAGSSNPAMADAWLERLVRGASFATVGISHLTTSRRYLHRPALSATPTADRYVLNGTSPWVTGGPHAEVFVVGAELHDGRQILVAVPASRPGIRAGRGCELVALSASCTDRVDFDEVEIEPAMLLDGPAENVMQRGSGANTGGLQTSTLALGLARSACDYLQDEALRREDLRDPAAELRRELDALQSRLLRAAAGASDCDTADLRGAANRLVLRMTQAAMTAAKGAGFVQGHPVGRWCREALFFLVWSCPPPVAHAHLCELAFGVEER
jgi:alkylation response protein AidB-like acyl-CoA dehydrogenase